jgi:hypothetical protein
MITAVQMAKVLLAPLLAALVFVCFPLLRALPTTRTRIRTPT